MTDLRKAAEMALDALERCEYGVISNGRLKNSIEALRQALAQSKEQGVITYRTGYDSGYMDASVASNRKWVGLTWSEIMNLIVDVYGKEYKLEKINPILEILKNAEAKLKGKNGG